jgi:hypothetical protein
MIHTRIYALSLFSSLLMIGFAAPPAVADSCQPVFDALTKIVTTPSHSYATGVVNGKPRSTETIYVQGKIYMIVKGKWMLSPVTPDDVLEQEKENRANSKATCQFLRNESVNGEPAAVYSLRRETETGKEDGQLWISRVTGRALRNEVDVDRGAMGKSHLSARYEYTNIKPPM